MAKVDIWCSEWYPVYEPFKPEEDLTNENNVEIPDELWERWVKLEKEFEEIQLELEKYYKEPDYGDF